MKPLWVVLVLLAVLTPLGLFATGEPWGEWSSEELFRLLGYVPAGIEKYGGGWKGLLPDYSLPGASGPFGGLIYIFSALLGSALVVALVYIWGRLWKR